MRLRSVSAALGLLAAALSWAVAEPERALPLDQVRSGKTFQSAATQALQSDDFANPGFLWVDQGRALWSRPGGKANTACADCHDDDGASLGGAAARYPAYDSATGRLLNLEQRINACRTRYQKAAPWAWESSPLLALTAFVASLARGVPLTPSIDGPARPFFAAGRQLYVTRIGQLNLACTHCHDANYGRMLRGDRISQGHGNGYPAYRWEWQAIGSLHRRLRACNLGVRAEPFAYGSPEYVSLELFLAWRASGLTVETPAVRR